MLSGATFGPPVGGGCRVSIASAPGMLMPVYNATEARGSVPTIFVNPALVVDADDVNRDTSSALMDLQNDVCNVPGIPEEEHEDGAMSPSSDVAVRPPSPQLQLPAVFCDDHAMIQRQGLLRRSGACHEDSHDDEDDDMAHVLMQVEEMPPQEGDELLAQGDDERSHSSQSMGSGAAARGARGVSGQFGPACKEKAHRHVSRYEELFVDFVLSCRGGDTDTVRMLLRRVCGAGKGPGQQQQQQQQGSKPQVVDMVEFRGPGGQCGLTIAVRQGHAGVVKEVLAVIPTGRPFLTDDRGNTAIHHAVLRRKAKCLELLLAYARRNGVAVSTPNRDGATPLMLAVATNSLTMVKLLLSGLHGVALRDVVLQVHKPSGATAMHMACTDKADHRVVRWMCAHDRAATFINARSACGSSPLALACRCGNAKAVFELLRHPFIDVTMRNAAGDTCAHAAAAEPTGRCLRLLLAHGWADVKCCNNKGRTPLHVAADAGHADVQSVLLSHPLTAQLATAAFATPGVTATTHANRLYVLPAPSVKRKQGMFRKLLGKLPKSPKFWKW